MAIINDILSTTEGSNSSDSGIGAYTSGPIDVNLTNAYQTTNYSGVRITSSTWWTNSSTTYKIFEILYTYIGNAIVPATRTQNLYASDGITILHSLVDTITYTNNIFEQSRNRTIT